MSKVIRIILSFLLSINQEKQNEAIKGGRHIPLKAKPLKRANTRILGSTEHCAGGGAARCIGVFAARAT
jgi:hypothetical protein